MTDWQPIETAPKDGTRVLVCQKDGAVDIAQFERGESEWVSDEGKRIEPSHWMPLPPPPPEKMITQAEFDALLLELGGGEAVPITTLAEELKKRYGNDNDR